jgi:lipoate-protein ligase A
VILGRFQEVNAEIDTSLCHKSRIEIARRFTGGGTVFHDDGNLNFSIATRREEGIPLAEFQAHNCTVISTLLDKLGLKSEFVPPNSIEVSAKKISGAAAALGRDFAFWHASILISTDVSLLNQVLLLNQKVKATKFVPSTRRRVTTLDIALGKHLEMEDVKQQLVGSCEQVFGVIAEAGDLSTGEERLMRSLYANKYSSQAWNLQGLGDAGDS